MPDQRGRVAVVTGASSGLGAVVAASLSEHGATVVMAVRDLEKGERVRAGLSPELAGRVEVRSLELDDLESVRRFAEGLLRDHPRLDLLVNNAGTVRSEKQLSAQGFQSVVATNHLGHFALTALVLDALQAGDQARVVTVGSNLTQRMKVTLPLDDLSDPTSAGKAYVGSKLANLMFAHELERRLRAASSPVRSLAVHPGVAATPLQRQAGNPLEWVIGRALGLALGRSAAAGAIPLLFAATAPEAPAGVFLGPGLRKRDVRVHAEALVPPANDVALARRLWTVSQQATGERLLDA